MLAAALCVLAHPAEAQLGKIKKKIGLPGAAEPAPATTTTTNSQSGSGLTADAINRFLTGLKVENAELNKAAANARQKKVDSQKAQQQKSLDMVAQMTRHSECVDSVAKRDPANADRDKVLDEASKASLAGDGKKAQALRDKADQMDEAMQTRGESACADSKMDMNAFTQSGEQPELESEGEAMRNARPTAEAAGAQAAGFTEMEYGQVREKVLGQLLDPKTSRLSDAEAKNVEPRRKELSSALGVSQ
ncbi:MAG: hypothetical protein ACRDV9_10665 [Acidimicrobiia bacterium]